MSAFNPGQLVLSLLVTLIGQSTLQAQVPCEQSVVPNPLALDGDFGQSLDYDGDTLAIGMPTVSFSPGYTCIYRRTTAGLELQALLQAPDGKNADLFGWSVALEGDRLLVGRQSDGALNSKGSVYAYQRQESGLWTMIQKLTNNKPGIWAFCAAMSIDGNRVAITAKSTGLSPRGRVYIFELENGLWVEKAEVGPSLDDNDDWFGASVALQGDRLVVGAPKNGTGRAYVFDRQANGAWVEQALLTPPIVNPTGDEYGGAVELDGDTVVVGSIGHDLPVLNNGAAFVYRLGPTGWALEQKLTLENSPIIPRFGYSLELQGDDLFVSAPTDFTQYQSSGFVYRYTRSATSWNLVGKFEASAPAMGRWFGSKLARNGTELAISAPALGTTFPGKVHLFALNPSTHLEASKGQVSTSAGGTQPLQLAACSEHAGDFYLLLGTLSGTAPVLPLGSLDLPLVPDAYTQFTLAFPNSPLLSASLGQLDPWGRANASLVLPPGSAPSFVGQTAHHAFVVLDQTSLALESVSNPTPVLLAP